jgi:hypothetical protein
MKLLRGRTSFVVAHPLSTIWHADLVLVWKRGASFRGGTSWLGGRYVRMYQKSVSSTDPPVASLGTGARGPPAQVSSLVLALAAAREENLWHRFHIPSSSDDATIP